MDQLLNFTQPFNVSLLEQVVSVLNNPGHPEHGKANQVLMQLKENVEAWQFVDTILETSQDQATKFFGLQILENTILFRWKALPAEQREGVKNYVVNKIIELSKDPSEMQRNEIYISKLNLILVGILKQEWPHNWPSFITDLVNSSKTSQSLCENNMQILKLLSEEVFDFSKEQMTTEKITTMKAKLNEEFRQIFMLCELVLNESQVPSLLRMTLQTLLRFLTWIPLGYIFQTNLVEVLLNKFLPTNLFRNDTLRCLTEIGSLEIPDDSKEKYLPVVQKIFDTFLNQLMNVLLPPQTDVAAAYERAGEDDCVFVHHLSLFLTGILQRHLKVFERPENHNQLLSGLKYLVKISEVNDPEIFKICLEFWNALTKDLHTSESSMAPSILAMNQPQSMSARKMLYTSILSDVRNVMISNMAKPEEVLVVEDECGQIVREQTKDTDAIAQYKTMRETLVYLTHLNYDDTENIMLSKLASQCVDNGSDFTWNKLNTLCWAIGSISGAMSEDDERRFLVTVIKDLLGLCEHKRGKDNKAVVASNIMYVVGQYPRFLRAHWKFLRTVVNKLFEFMHERHPGVQDMACDTFLKIAQKCRRKFVMPQSGEPVPYIELLLSNLQLTVSDLEPHQVETFYEACGHMISAQSDRAIRDKLLQSLMNHPNLHWEQIMQAAQSNVDLLLQPEQIKDCLKILRTNVRVCQSLGHPYITQLGSIYANMLQLYKTYSEYISHAISQQGVIATQHLAVRSMRAVKKETLKLVETFVSKSEDPTMVANDVVTYLYEPVLSDYNRSVPDARDAEVLSLFRTIFNSLQHHMTSNVPMVFDATFQVTLEMITTNFEDYPEHRINFYLMLKAAVTHCFPALHSFNADVLKKIVDAIAWGFKHRERNIAETSLDIMYTFLMNAGQKPDFEQAFYQNHLLMVLQDILYVLTDRFHKSGFKMHATILQHIFTIVENGQVQVPLYDPSKVNVSKNQDFLRQYVTEMLANAFPNIGKSVAHNFVNGLFDLNKDLNAFKVHLRDFLIQLKEFSAEDNTDLFAEEKAREQAAKAATDLQARKSVPGLINPNDMDDLADL